MSRHEAATGPGLLVVGREVVEAEGVVMEVIHVNAGSCNGCDAEVVAGLASCRPTRPRRVEARVLLVTGVAGPRTGPLLEQLYRGLPGPKAVVAVGACAIHGGVFRAAGAAGAPAWLPVDVYAPGCPVRPETLRSAISLAARVVREREERG